MGQTVSNCVVAVGVVVAVCAVIVSLFFALVGFSGPMYNAYTFTFSLSFSLPPLSTRTPTTDREPVMQALTLPAAPISPAAASLACPMRPRERSLGKVISDK